MEKEVKNELKYESVEEFLKNDRVKRADVVLMRNKKAFFSWLIMWATKSRWSHAALIFAVPNFESGFDNTFVIESTGDGVDIADLRYYLEEHSEEYDVGIKRVERDWLTNDKEGLVIRKKIRGSTLNLIKAKYDFGKILHIARMVIGRIIFGIKVRATSLEKVVERARKKGKRVPSQFICSGLVQYGYYSMVKRLIKDEELEPENLDEVIFNPRYRGDEAVLLSTTPAEIANTDNLSWKYLIRKGKVFSVSSNEEADHILEKKNI